ncbi:MAG: aconitate hydratase AcnA [Candidatus Bipolaricaulia bacterium]
MTQIDSFESRGSLVVGDHNFMVYRLSALEEAGIGEVSRLPFSLKILLENLLRYEDGHTVRRSDIETLARWDPAEKTSQDMAFHPARVLLQDFTGVPALVDLAAMRDAMVELGGDPGKINPIQPADLVIDHSVQVDAFASRFAFQRNAEREFERNRERYSFLRWGQKAFRDLRVVPPATGIVHQVNLEYLADVVFGAVFDGERFAYPDTLVGTDSHTTMINGLGVLGWGVGGIEAEAAMLGQPISMQIPEVVGFRLKGELPAGTTATDLVLTVTQMLREYGVVGKFVEFFGPGLASLSLPDRATIANMAPEYGATVGFFPVDQEALDYLRFTGRSEAQVTLVEVYAKFQGLFHTVETPSPVFSATLELDLSTVEPSLAGPKRPQDRVRLRESKANFNEALQRMREDGVSDRAVSVTMHGDRFELRDGAVVIAAITSCTNTSNPAVMIAAGLLARKAAERGLTRRPWVKTSLAPGSKVVTDYLQELDLIEPLESLGFHLVGYGCTTCIGNSGPLPDPVAQAIEAEDLVAVSVLSGNRNFEARIHSLVKANYLASPPLVVVYALAGRMDIDLYSEPLAHDPHGDPVYLRDLWPSPDEIREAIRSSVRSEMFSKQYAAVFEGDERWQDTPVPDADLFPWDAESTYIKRPSFLEGLSVELPPLEEIRGARVLVMLGDSVTTDHISPAGAIPVEGPAGRYLIEQGVEPKDFNSFGSRRGNHEVMIRGTFGNVRLKNLLVPGTEGNWTVHHPTGEQMSIYDAAMAYRDAGIPLIVLAGKEYGTGSSRDWAAKGTTLLGVQAVLAESFERIHRSNLVGIGVLPLQFRDGENRETLSLDGTETYDIEGISAGIEPGQELTVRATRDNGSTQRFRVVVRIDTLDEALYYQHGGILSYVLRQRLKQS